MPGGPATRSSAVKPDGCNLIIVTDPGPDPDDVKALLTAAVKHRHGDIRLLGVVANGGCQARQRAQLARALLNLLECEDIPVGVGRCAPKLRASPKKLPAAAAPACAHTPLTHHLCARSAGKAYDPKPHEYALPTAATVRPEELHDGSELLRRLVREAAPASLTFLMISAMTDLAELMRDEPELIHAKVRHLCVMGGLQKSGADQWEPDTAVNNNWDPAAAKLMYDFCFGRGIPMSVVSRNAVPNLPMQLAKDFAAREPKNVIMEYLVNAQELGLCGLWKTLCAGRLPERCSKQWYFETFCGVDAETFAAKRAFYEGLGPDAEISPYLNGHVKPYDVCALIFALPDAASAFDLRPRLEEAKGTTHRFYLEPSAMISLEKITKLLSETFLEVCEGFSGLEAASWSADRYQPASSTTSTGTSASSAGDAAPAPAQTRTAAS